LDIQPPSNGMRLLTFQSEIGMTVMMPDDKDTHGISVNPEQKMVGEPVEICPAQIASDRMNPSGVFANQSDVSHKFIKECVPNPGPPTSS
jgi:hypothetical protein